MYVFRLYYVKMDLSRKLVSEFRTPCFKDFQSIVTEYVTCAFETNLDLAEEGKYSHIAFETYEEVQDNE